MNEVIKLNRKEFLKLVTHPAVKTAYTYYTAAGKEVTEMADVPCYVVYAGVKFELDVNND